MFLELMTYVGCEQDDQAAEDDSQRGGGVQPEHWRGWPGTGKVVSSNKAFFL